MLGERIYNYFPVAIEDRCGKYAVQFYVGAVLAVFKRWFDNGMVESVEEITEITEEVMDEVVEELTEENSTEDTNNAIEN